MIAPGATFGRYRVQRLLGEGGFATVWLARDPVLQRDVALKVRRDAWWSDEDVLGEARALARLSHPSIVQVLDVGEADEGLYFVLEYVEGEDLESLATRIRRPLSPSVALSLLEGPADALDHAHGEGVLHRDLKPGNLLVPKASAQSIVSAPKPREPLGTKVTDFGLAALFRKGARTAAAEGDPGYVAPEAWRGSADPSSDVFSLAATFFRLVAGRPPIPGSTAMEQLAAAGQPARLRLSELAPNVPRALDDAMSAALSSRRHERPRDARALLESLRTALTRDDERKRVVSEARERIDARRPVARTTCSACLRPLHPRSTTCNACGEPVQW